MGGWRTVSVKMQREPEDKCCIFTKFPERAVYSPWAECYQ